MPDFGDYLKELRGKRSLREMEKVTGLSHTYLSSLEKGFDPRSQKERKPTPETLKKLSTSLNVSYDDLMLKAGYIDENLYLRKTELRNKINDMKNSTVEDPSAPYRKDYSYIKNHLDKLDELEKRRLFLEIEETRLQLIKNLKNSSAKELVEEELDILNEVEYDLLKSMKLIIEKE